MGLSECVGQAIQHIAPSLCSRNRQAQPTDLREPDRDAPEVLKAHFLDEDSRKCSSCRRIKPKCYFAPNRKTCIRCLAFRSRPPKIHEVELLTFSWFGEAHDALHPMKYCSSCKSMKIAHHFRVHRRTCNYCLAVRKLRRIS